MLSWFFLAAVGASVLYSVTNGTITETIGQMLTAAGEGVTLALGMAGGFAFFCGFIEILSRAGAAKALAGALRPALRRLFGDMPKDAEEPVVMNLVSNMLGLGNAATPMGVLAAQRLRDGARASNALCMFLVVNCSSVQLLPSTVIALRAASGSMQPAAIILPALIATCASTAVGILACKGMERFS